MQPSEDDPLSLFSRTGRTPTVSPRQSPFPFLIKRKHIHATQVTTKSLKILFYLGTRKLLTLRRPPAYASIRAII